MSLTDERIKEIAGDLADIFADEEGGYSQVAWFIASGIRQALKESQPKNTLIIDFPPLPTWPPFKPTVDKGEG